MTDICDGAKIERLSQCHERSAELKGHHSGTV